MDPWPSPSQQGIRSRSQTLGARGPSLEGAGFRGHLAFSIHVHEVWGVLEGRKEGIKGRVENRGLMIDFLQSWWEGWSGGNLALLFQEVEKADVSVSVRVLSLHPGEARRPQQLQEFVSTGCQSHRRHRDQFSSLQEIDTR